MGAEAAYWATPARLGEILVGALVAVILHGRWSRRPLPRPVAWRGVAGLGVLAWAAVTWPAGTGPAYEGWLPVFALATAGLVVGLQVPSPLRRLLATRPLVALGMVSYGVYLYHWPVYVVLDEQRTGLPSTVLFTVRVAVTLGLAVVSFRLLERPIRTGGLPRPALAGVAACSSVALFVAVIPLDTTPYWMQPTDEASAATLAPVDSVVELRAATTSTSTSTSTSVHRGPVGVAMLAEVELSTVRLASAPTTTTSTLAPTTTIDPYAVPALPEGMSRPVRIMVVGDSTAWATGDGLLEWAQDHPDAAQVAVVGAPGCGFLRGGVGRTDSDAAIRSGCERLLEERLPAKLASLQPDVVVGMVTIRDIEDRLWDEAEGSLAPTDPRFTARLVADYDAATAVFEGASVARILWVLAPIPALPYSGDDAGLIDPARCDAYGAALAEVVARHPGRAAVIDLRGWLARQPAMPQRPDGLHWSRDAATRIATEYLGPVVVAAAVT